MEQGHDQNWNGSLGQVRLFLILPHGFALFLPLPVHYLEAGKLHFVFHRTFSVTLNVL